MLALLIVLVLVDIVLRLHESRRLETMSDVELHAAQLWIEGELASRRMDDINRDVFMAMTERVLERDDLHSPASLFRNKPESVWEPRQHELRD